VAAAEHLAAEDWVAAINRSGRAAAADDLAAQSVAARDPSGRAISLRRNGGHKQCSKNKNNRPHQSLLSTDHVASRISTQRQKFLNRSGDSSFVHCRWGSFIQCMAPASDLIRRTPTSSCGNRYGREDSYEVCSAGRMPELKCLCGFSDREDSEPEAKTS